MYIHTFFLKPNVFTISSVSKMKHFNKKSMVCWNLCIWINWLVLAAWQLQLWNSQDDSQAERMVIPHCGTAVPWRTPAVCLHHRWHYWKVLNSLHFNSIHISLLPFLMQVKRWKIPLAKIFYKINSITATYLFVKSSLLVWDNCDIFTLGVPIVVDHYQGVNLIHCYPPHDMG
jgi:hypothetical protein